VPVSFNGLAERELNEAAQYYESEQAGLGAAFLSDVRRCTDAVVANPHAGQIVLQSIRRRLCQRFPYGLLYTVTDGEVRVLAVMNLRRRPGYWVGRH
jgi:plasmid stabilization system protein ParE